MNLINTDKFKTNLVSIYIVRPLLREEATKNALLPLVLRRGSERYRTSLNIQKELDKLYGGNLNVSVTKKGERQIIRFAIEIVNSKFIKEDSLFDKSLKILNEIINNPLINDGKFDDKYVEQEKRNLVDRIKSRINDKKSYAVDRCIEEMCKNENYSIYKFGFIEDIKDIDSESLFTHYKKIIETSPIEINIVGNIPKDYALKAAEKYLSFQRQEIINIPRENVLKDIQTKNRIYEEMEVNQGKLTIGFRTNIPYEDDLYEGIILASNLLGGGTNSKLFKNVREKESLAYYIYAKTYKLKSLMIIASGIEFENFDKTLDIIKKQVEELKEGTFTDEDIKHSKNAIVTSIRSMIDSNYSLSEFYFTQILTNESKSINEMIDKIRGVTKENIIKAAQKISLDTIYFLKNKREMEEEKVE